MQDLAIGAFPTERGMSADYFGMEGLNEKDKRVPKCGPTIGAINGECHNERPDLMAIPITRRKGE